MLIMYQTQFEVLEIDQWTKQKRLYAHRAYIHVYKTEMGENKQGNKHKFQM